MKRFMMLAAGTFMLFGLAPAQVQAAEQCVVNYNRTACPGQEAVSYRKCDGKTTCAKEKKVASLAACQAAAVQACGNRRLNITKSKVITAMWQGKPIKSASGKDDFCADYAKRAEEFNRCSK